MVEYRLMSHEQLARIAADAYHRTDFEVDDLEIIREGRVYAIRGTNEWNDVWTDLRIFPWWTTGIGWCPSGVVKLSKRVAAVIAANYYESDWPVILTGHSLGGAVALVTGALLIQMGIPVAQIVTFGAQLTGRLKILKDVKDVTCYRNGSDIVPCVPPLFRRPKELTFIGPGPFKSGYIRDHSIDRYFQNLKH